uniref:Small ribosomal subunit protein mS38 n=1 Tax=Davidia involucrata TaxID=16924 RepID=A0A5B7B9X7_DAVIN
MASLLQKLLSKQSAARIITIFNEPQSPNLTLPLVTHIQHQPHLTETESHHPYSINLIPFLRPPKTEDSIPSHPLQFYPSFPFGFILNPISSTGFLQSEADDVVSSDSHMIWADSVKEKRKRKMNKRKYKKLRKRLRNHS